MSTLPNFASLIFLSYNRGTFILEAIQSATENAGYPHEVIVVDDGSSDESIITDLRTWQREGRISTLVTSVPGHNEGVGHSINVGFQLAAGDPILKLDQDMLYERDWLARVVGVLRQDEAVGMLGLFKYHHEPVIWSEQKIDVPTKGGYHYTRQFCGSGFAVPRHIWEKSYINLGEHSDAFCEDSEYMAAIRAEGYELALPDVDLASNRGFGIGPSTVVEEGYVVHKIHHGPYVLGQTEKPLPPQEPQVAIDTSEANDLLLVAEELGVDLRDEGELQWPGPRFDVGIVITTCAGREDNLRRTVSRLMDMTRDPRAIVIVYDGIPAMGFETRLPIHGVEIPKHAPGQEQPRNVGFRRLREIAPECNYCWFLDSDLIFDKTILEHFYTGLLHADEERILIGPYDWLTPGHTELEYDRQSPHIQVQDYRWCSFDEFGPERVLRHDLGAGLACFSGNLMYPVDRFEEVGGFHPDLHHGRCEDGELGLRAASQGIPMSFVRDARAWHVWHRVDSAAVMEKNSRDVPLLNSIHPWVEGEGLLMVAEDGARFDWRCPDCSETVNSLEYWKHSATHRQEIA